MLKDWYMGKSHLAQYVYNSVNMNETGHLKLTLHGPSTSRTRKGPPEGLVPSAQASPPLSLAKLSLKVQILRCLIPGSRPAGNWVVTQGGSWWG